MSQMHTSTEAG